MRRTAALLASCAEQTSTRHDVVPVNIAIRIAVTPGTDGWKRPKPVDDDPEDIRNVNAAVTTLPNVPL